MFYIHAHPYEHQRQHKYQQTIVYWSPPPPPPLPGAGLHKGHATTNTHKTDVRKAGWRGTSKYSLLVGQRLWLLEEDEEEVNMERKTTTLNSRLLASPFVAFASLWLIISLQQLFLTPYSYYFVYHVCQPCSPDYS